MRSVYVGVVGEAWPPEGQHDMNPPSLWGLMIVQKEKKIKKEIFKTVLLDPAFARGIWSNGADLLSKAASINMDYSNTFLNTFIDTHSPENLLKFFLITLHSSLLCFNQRKMHLLQLGAD